MKIWILFLALLLIHLGILLSLQFTAWPEMFSYPFLINNRFSLYKDIALPYEPLLNLVLAQIYQLFGYSLTTLKIITWSLIILTDFVIFLTSIKLIGKKLASLIPIALYVFIQPFADGNTLWFDLATVPFIILALWCYLFLKNFSQLFLVGFLLSLASMIKQQAAISLLFVIIYFTILEIQKITKGNYCSHRTIKEAVKAYIPFFFGILIPLIFSLTYVAIKDIWRDYIFWTIEVPLIWYPKFPGYTRLPNLIETIKTILLFAPGLILAFKKFKKTKDLIFILIIFFSVFIVAFPRFEFFRMQPAIAVYIVLLAYLWKDTSDKKKLLIVPIIFLTLLLIIKNSSKLFLPTRFYGPQDLKIAATVASQTSHKIYLLGLSSLIYVMSEKLPPKPWVDNYIWYMEIPGIQEKVITGMENEPPGVIFWNPPDKGNWYDLGVYQPQKITNYIKGNYQYTGDIDKGIQIWIKK